MNPIDRYISRACPLMFGAHHRIDGSEKGWVEDEKKLPVKLRCKGFRAVLMILGRLVYVTEGEGGEESFHIGKETNVEKKISFTLKPSKNPTILNSFLKRKN